MEMCDVKKWNAHLPKGPAWMKNLRWGGDVSGFIAGIWGLERWRDCVWSIFFSISSSLEWTLQTDEKQDSDQMTGNNDLRLCFMTGSLLSVISRVPLVHGGTGRDCSVFPLVVNSGVSSSQSRLAAQALSLPDRVRLDASCPSYADSTQRLTNGSIPFRSLYLNWQYFSFLFRY